MKPTADHYNELMAPKRREIFNSPRVDNVLGPDSRPEAFLSWLINFTTLGVQMTKPVESWIRRAGERTIAVGVESIGHQLVRHSVHERDHHVMIEEDAKHLGRRWMAAGRPQLDVAALHARPATKAMQAYIDLHESVIASKYPFGQVAIEREIEGLALVVGPRIIAQSQRIFGDDGLHEITFVTSHVELDVGHTAFNNKLIGKLLDARPDALEMLVETGANALQIYMDFLDDCATMDLSTFELAPA